MPAMSRANAVRNWFASFAFACGAVLSFACVALAWRWDAAAPLQPDMAHGLVMPHKSRGILVYLSAFQSTSLALMFWSAPIFFVSGFVLSPKRDRTTRSDSLGFVVRWHRDDPRQMGRWGRMAGLVAALAFVFGVGPQLVMQLIKAGVTLAF